MRSDLHLLNKQDSDLVARLGSSPQQEHPETPPVAQQKQVDSQFTVKQRRKYTRELLLSFRNEWVPLKPTVVKQIELMEIAPVV